MNRAFSLVELSIVLVILGLLTGGILAGQSLIRAAELRSITTDTTRFITAVQSFRDKYFALPGDMRNAQSFWGIQHATPATCITTASTTALTCNGDGNGAIGNSVGTYYEMFRAWQHLTNAGLVEGSFNGVVGAGGTTHAVINTNVPSGRMNNLGYTFYGLGTVPNSTSFFEANYGSAMAVGGQNAATITNGQVLKPEELWNIDTKMDDGRPAYGSIVSYPATARPNCATTDVPSTANYELTNSNITCAYLLKTGF